MDRAHHWLLRGAPGIEAYFRLLKTGTRVDDRQPRAAVVLAKCLSFDAVTAGSAFSLDRYARYAPDTAVLTADERPATAAVAAAAAGARAAPPVFCLQPCDDWRDASFLSDSFRTGRMDSCAP